MRTILLCSIVYLLLPTNGWAQSFQKTYMDGDYTNTYGSGLIQRPDGKYLMSGEYSGLNTTPYSWLACMEPDGELAWIEKIDSSYSGASGLGSLAPLPDNSVVGIFSYSYSALNSGTRIIRFAPDGTVMWSKGLPKVGLGYTLATNTNIYAGGRGNHRAYIGKLDYAGQVIWEKYLNQDTTVVLTFLKLLPNNHLLAILQNPYITAAPFPVHLVELTEEGETVRAISWSMDYITDVLVLANGQLAIIGQGLPTLSGLPPNNCYIAMLNSNWQTQWIKSFRIGENSYPQILQRPGQDSLLLCIGGHTNSMLRAISLDLQGNIGSQTTIPIRSFAYSIATADGGLGVRTITLADTIAEEHLVVAKTDPQLRIPGCPIPESFCTIEVIDTTFFVQPSTWSFSPTSQIKEAQTTLIPKNWQTIDYCPPLPTLHADFSASDTTPCINSAVQFFPMESASSLWDFSGAFPANSSQPFPSDIIFSTPGIKAIRHIAKAGCLVDTAYLSINVQPAPRIKIEGDSIYCTGSAAQLHVTGELIDQLLWSDGSTDTSRTASEGIYTVTAYTVGECTAIDSIKITEKPAPDLVIQGEEQFCSGDNLVINAISTNPDVTYLWENGATSMERIINQSGVYTIVATNADGCTSSKDINISEVDRPSVHIDISADLSCTGTLSASSDQFNITFLWNSGEASNVLQVAGTGWHTVVVANDYCENADSVYLDLPLCAECRVYIPNVFAPNGSKDNSQFQISSGCTFSDFSLQIFDRWGALVFQSQRSDLSWNGTVNGKIALPGVYLFQLRTWLDNGNKRSYFLKSGDLTLVR